jgi:hypothetical protein
MCKLATEGGFSAVMPRQSSRLSVSFVKMNYYPLLTSVTRNVKSTRSEEELSIGNQLYGDAPRRDEFCG